MPETGLKQDDRTALDLLRETRELLSDESRFMTGAVSEFLTNQITH